MSLACNGRIHRAATARLVLALASALALGVVPAQGATIAYPAGASTFDGSAQGWVDAGSSCTLLAGTGVVCTTDNAHDPAGGNPGGALATNVTVTANAGGLIRGAGAWLSPSFTVRDGAVANVVFQYDRLFDAGGLARLDPRSEVVVTLIDQESGGAVTLLTEMLDETDASFAPSGVGVSAASVVPAHTYRLRIATETTSEVQSVAVLGQSSTRFDNVRLAVSDELPGGGGTAGTDGGSGPSVSTGVRSSTDP